MPCLLGRSGEHILFAIYSCDHNSSPETKMNVTDENTSEVVEDNGQDIFLKLLSFIKFVVNKRCFSEEHYHQVRLEFVM